jgi:hypothetical protein
VLECSVAGAQTRIASQLEPKPEQTIHVTTTQTLSIRMNIGAANPPTDAQMTTETVLSYTQANGRFEEQNHMESKLTIERIELRQSVLGTEKSANMAEVVGRSVTAVFDREGKLVDLKVPQDLQQAGAVLKQLTAGAYGIVNFLPAVAMSVGETVTSPSTVPMRLPGGTPVPYQTRTATTLRAVEKNGDDRIAHFEQRIEPSTQTEQLKVTGAGTIDVNLDRGFVSASAIEWSFSGNVGIGGTTPAQSGPVSGIIKVTIAAHE